MGVPLPPSGLPQPPQLANPWWWLPGATVVVAGVALVGLGVYDHDNVPLLTGGVGLATAAAGFLLGKQQPVP